MIIISLLVIIRLNIFVENLFENYLTLQGISNEGSIFTSILTSQIKIIFRWKFLGKLFYFQGISNGLLKLYI